jgi:glucokinase
MILAGDIGGTNSRIALFDGTTLVGRIQKYPSKDHGHLRDVVKQFRKDRTEKIDRACFGVAGPVAEGRAELTNLSWVLEERDLASAMGVPVRLINDLVSHAWGVDVVEHHHRQFFRTLRPGQRVSDGSRAYIAAGTGLGEAGAVYMNLNGQVWHEAFASEGGHCDFSPSNDLQLKLRAFLATSHARVTWEHVLSGSGLRNVYAFIASLPEFNGTALSEARPSSKTIVAGVRDRVPACVQAWKLFTELYGSEAGNLALKTLCTGGLYVIGNIIADNLDIFEPQRFLSAMSQKGQANHESLLRNIPVHLINFDDNGLYGAANYAVTRMG